MTRQVSPLALAALALMALALAALWFGPGPAAAWRQWQPPAPQAPNLDDAKAATLQFNPAAGAAYPAVLQRPLMDASRRPAPPPASTASEPAAPPPTAIEQVTMQGIVAGPTLTGVFLQEDGAARFVRLGEKVGDWTLDSIHGRDIIFKRGAEQHRIELLPAPQPDPKQAQAGDKAKAAPGQPTPAAAPRPPGAGPAQAPQAAREMTREARREAREARRAAAQAGAAARPAAPSPASSGSATGSFGGSFGGAPLRSAAPNGR